MKKIYSLLFIFFMVYGNMYAQQLPSFSHYYINPYVYNPSFVGSSGYNEIFMTHRRQWMGIEGAPVTSELSVHLPTKGKVAFGIRINNYSRGLLSTTSGIFTVGYTAKLADDQYLRAGLSGGIGMNAIDLEQVENTNDPALNNALNKSMFFDGNAGINYQYKKLNLGVSLPKIFQRNIVHTDKFNQLEVKRLDHFLFTASYRFNFSNNTIAFEPQLVYQVAEGLPKQMEALGTIYLHDKLWFGGSYRTDNGPTAFAGVKLSDKLKFGYAYEMAPARLTGMSNGTHELMLNLRFGKKKIQNRKTSSIPTHKTVPQPDKLKQAKDTYIEKELSKIPAKPSQAPSTPALNAKPEQINTPANKSEIDATPEVLIIGKKYNAEFSGKAEEKIVEQKKGHPLELEKGHYVVVCAFRVFDNVAKYHEYLSDKYFSSQFGFSSKSFFYYEYLLKTDDLNKARAGRDRIRKTKGFEESWVLTMSKVETI